MRGETTQRKSNCGVALEVRSEMVFPILSTSVLQLNISATAESKTIESLANLN